MDQFEVSKQRVKDRYEDDRKRTDSEYKDLEERYTNMLQLNG